MENLHNLGINSVSVVSSIAPHDGDQGQLSEMLGKHQVNWPRRSIDKLGFYEVDGIRHHMGLDIEPYPKAKPDMVLVTIEAHSFSEWEPLRSPTRRKQERQFDEIQAILSDIGGLDLRSQAHSHMTWIFQPDSMKPIIGLPMMTIQNPSIPFTEISGVRLRKRTSEGLTTVTIDLREDSYLIVTLAFHLTGIKISESILDYATKKGNQIIPDFVSKSGIPNKGEV